MRVKAAVAGRACNNVRVLESFQIYVSQKEGIHIRIVQRMKMTSQESSGSLSCGGCR